jgi:hypothetical protein
MKRVFAAVLATACIVASTPGFARGAVGHGGGFRGGFVRNPTTLLGSPAPQMPVFQKPDSGPARGTYAGARHQRAGGAEPVRGSYVG